LRPAGIAFLMPVPACGLNAACSSVRADRTAIERGEPPMSSPARTARTGPSARAIARLCPPRRAALALALALGMILGRPPARADDLDESVPLQHALDASRQVLLLVPQAVHQDCIDALRELSSTKDAVDFDVRTRARNLAVARDVLAADYDSAARSCGEDAARACAPASATRVGTPAGTGRTAALVHACGQMQTLPPP
jgi:hypothetical protein